jgi:hypothetical protein
MSVLNEHVAAAIACRAETSDDQSDDLSGYDDCELARSRRCTGLEE